MLSGTFVGNTPFVRVVLGWGRSVQAPFVIVDTGFTGDLQVTSAVAQELGLEVAGVTNVRMADGQLVRVPVALALASMEDAVQEIQVLISDSAPLAGISFFSKFGYKIIVDCKDKTVLLDRV